MGNQIVFYKEGFITNDGNPELGTAEFNYKISKVVLNFNNDSEDSDLFKKWDSIYNSEKFIELEDITENKHRFHRASYLGSVMERTIKMNPGQSIVDLSYEDLKDDLELPPPCTQ
jgi:hypothetical protein